MFYISLWNPVCGRDGETYSNASESACNSIFDFTQGECGTTNDILGCTDDSALNYNPLATLDNGSCIYIEDVFGCTDITACNYNSEATFNDFSCSYAEQYYDCEGECLADLDDDNICDVFDNCISISNFNQLDTESDGEGDVCDYDDNLYLDELKSNSITHVFLQAGVQH